MQATTVHASTSASDWFVDQVAEQPAPPAGSPIAAWRLQREVHRGAYASVYQSRPQSHSGECPADYAVKILRDDPPRHLRDQFRREAWVGMHVGHPNMVPIFSAHCDGRPNYLVMPWIRGVTVAQLLKVAIRLPIGRAVWIARQVAEALAALHAAGWTHRDVKPANILVSREGHATLIDLGFAHPLSAAATADGPLAGSLAYAAPELFTTAPWSERADVYCLAMTLYEMLAGQLPFQSERPDELAEAHLMQTPADIRDHEPLVPRQVAWLLRRALAKEPLRRPTAEETRDVLAASEIDCLTQWFAR